MANKITRIIFGFVVVLFTLAGCGSENGEGWRSGDGGPTDETNGRSEMKVVFCPKSGGSVKFLKMDSLEMIGSDLLVPIETIYLGAAPSPSGFAALTCEAVYLMPTDEGAGIRSMVLPPLSGDVRVAPTGDGMIVLDRRARRLIGINLLEGTIEFDRSLNQYAEEVYYVRDQDKIILVMNKGTSGVVSVFSPEGGESMTINLDEILCSAIVAGEGRIYLATRGSGDRARLEAFRIKELSRIFDVDLEETPGSLVHAPGSGKIYAYHPETGIVRGIHLDKGNVVSEIPLGDGGDAVLYADEVGKYIYLLRGENGELTIISTGTDLVAGEIESQNGGTRLVTMPDSRYILLQDKGGTRVRLYDGEDFQLLRVFMEEEPMTIGVIRSDIEPPVSEEIQLVEVESTPPVMEVGSEAPPPVEPPDASELYELQIFASNDSSSSERVFDDLLTLGFPVIIEEAVSETGETWYRVKIGFFSGREDALAVGEYLNLVRGFEFWARPVDEGRESTWNPQLEGFLQGQDMDSDGYPEIAVVERGGVVHVFSFLSNRFVSRWSVTLPENQTLCGVITYADGNGDGMPEALLPLCPLDENYMIAWNGFQFTGDSGS